MTQFLQSWLEVDGNPDEPAAVELITSIFGCLSQAAELKGRYRYVLYGSVCLRKQLGFGIWVLITSIFGLWFANDTAEQRNTIGNLNPR